MELGPDACTARAALRSGRTPLLPLPPTLTIVRLPQALSRRGPAATAFFCAHRGSKDVDQPGTPLSSAASQFYPPPLFKACGWHTSMKKESKRNESQRSWEKRKDALDRHLDAGVSMDNVGWKGEGRQAGCHPAFEKCTLQTTKPPPSVGIANLIKRFQKYSTELAKPKNSHPKSCGDEFDRLVPHRCLHANLAPQGLASQADLQSGQAPRGGGGVC